MTAHSHPCVAHLFSQLLSVRDVFDHAFNVLGERSLKIDWTRFIVTNVISNVNYLMRIYRLTEQGVTHPRTPRTLLRARW